ncbi:hypothetical protein H9Q69_012421 [Fusarium xylarioides]|nr:hypothetical protein H9Q70_011837 [Fusarium xylarioides]KAG5774179.1 hypothetical protein H9Q73_011796 [Fusarium xylarioides]KAG5788523.1 hypothetical protein H9Q69_012421 [Fusarium xylarioides]KAG5815100.1 hypothetical protein H9Q71_002911 [Fusarium xylarioides]KAG5819987.1 hypothetical protein H9Q74_009135 [Fusarium xylarioides]
MTSTKPSCSLCDVSFDSSQEHRVHAKSETHVQALRNRAAASGLIEQQTEDSDSFSHTSNNPEDELSSSDDGTGDDTSSSAIPEFDPTHHRNRGVSSCRERRNWMLFVGRKER